MPVNASIEATVRRPQHGAMTTAETPGLRTADQHAVDAMPDVVNTYTYTAHWFSNATFVFPLFGALVTLIAWPIFGAGELLGISVFFGIITVLMLPLVALTWARTPTTIVARETCVETLHQGKLLKSLNWDDICAVRKKDTMGNIRWYIVGLDEEYISVEGEISEIDSLLETSRRLAGIPEGKEEAEGQEEAVVPDSPEVSPTNLD
jgi:hypothetical protein